MFAPSMKRKRPQSNAVIPVASQPIAFWFLVTSPSYPIHAGDGCCDETLVAQDIQGSESRDAQNHKRRMRHSTDRRLDVCVFDNIGCCRAGIRTHIGPHAKACDSNILCSHCQV